MNKNINFLSSVLVLCVFGITGANAAPSVRMLGANSTKVGTNASVVKSDNKTSTSTQRLGTIRSKAVSAGTPVNVNKVVTPSTATSSDSEARLSLGKYIHSTGVSAGTIKPGATTGSTAEVSSSDFVALSDQVRNLKDTKQDAISAGDGLVLDENTISLDSSAVQAQVEDVLGSHYYTKNEIDTKVANIAAGDMSEALTGKQDTITDLAAIRSGAAAGATAVQPAALNDYATIDALNLKANASALASYATTSALSDKQDKIDSEHKLSADLVSGLDVYATVTALNSKVDSSVLADYATTSALSDKQDKIDSEHKLSADLVSGLDAYATVTALNSGYYTKGEVDSKVANIVAGDLSSALSGKQDKIDSEHKLSADLVSGLDVYATVEAMNSKADVSVLSGYATTSALNDYATLEALNSKVDTSVLSGYATTSALNDYATLEALNSKVDTSVLSSYATTSALNDYATLEALNSKVDTSVLSGYATTSALDNYATVEALNSKADASALSSKADASALGSYLTTASASETYQPIGNYVSNPELPSESGNFVLVVNRDEEGAYTYSWKSAGAGGAGGGSGGDDDDWFDDSNW